MDIRQRQKNKTAVNLIDALKTLLSEGIAGTQEEIKNALQSRGIEVNQSKISRILRKIGAVKMVDEEGESVYSLPRNGLPPSTHSSLSQLIVSIVANETLIVIHTNPGSAPLIGRLLDHQTQELFLLGTVAGDDTIFVVPQSIQQIDKTLQAVKERLYSE